MDNDQGSQEDTDNPYPRATSRVAQKGSGCLS